MKKYIKRVIETAEELGYNQAFKASVEHLKSQGFELVLKKDLKAMEKLNKLYKSQITDLVHDNWEIAGRIYEAGLGAADPENTNVEASNFGEETLISTQAATAGARRGAEAMELEIDAIINSLDAHINKMTKVIDDANYTRIKFELDEMEAMLDEPMDQIDDPADDEAMDLYMYYIEMDHTPYQARLMALIFVKQKVEDSGYDHYWIDVYNNLKLMKYII